MTPHNVVEMLKTRGVIDKGLAYDIEQDAVQNGKDIVQVLLSYGIYTDEDRWPMSWVPTISISTISNRRPPSWR